MQLTEAALLSTSFEAILYGKSVLCSRLYIFDGYSLSLR